MHRIAYLSAAVVLSAATASPALAQNYRDYSCQDLWIARNQIYKDAGYCFKTTLSRGDRAEIDRIKRVESDKGCSD
jgi:hypothetical protein